MTQHITKPADFEWQTALRAIAVADAAYQTFKERYADPLFQREDALEALHGLVAPGGGRTATPGYFENRAALRAANPDCFVPDDISDALERLCTVFCDAQTAAMNTPAPDLAALRWKLDHAMSIESGGTDGWTVEYVKQMLADIDRLLPPAGTGA